jgi:serine/threonine protein kinase
MALAAAPEISGFRALSPLGYGPTSTIYSAQADSLGRWVALTVYSTSLPTERGQRRFARAFEVARRLGTHPHVVTMLETGLTPDALPYVATEIYDRGTLQGRIDARDRMPVDEVLHMGVLLAGALETAHRAEVVHGGIHPARVLLSSEGDPALADLGLVPLVDRGGLAALVSPMSFHAPPEVLEALPVTPATDVYALASTLYAALAGRAPYQRGDDDTTAALLVRILHEAVPPLDRIDAPRSLEEILCAALRSEPKDRPSRMLAFARQLQNCQKDLGLPISNPTVLDVASSIRVAGAQSPPIGTAPVVEPAPPSSGAPRRVFVPAPEDIPAPAAAVAPAAAPESPAPPPPVAADSPLVPPRPEPAPPVPSVAPAPEPGWSAVPPAPEPGWSPAPPPPEPGWSAVPPTPEPGWSPTPPPGDVPGAGSVPGFPPPGPGLGADSPLVPPRPEPAPPVPPVPEPGWSPVPPAPEPGWSPTPPPGDVPGAASVPGFPPPRADSGDGSSDGIRAPDPAEPAVPARDGFFQPIPTDDADRGSMPGPTDRGLDLGSGDPFPVLPPAGLGNGFTPGPTDRRPDPDLGLGARNGLGDHNRDDSFGLGLPHPGNGPGDHNRHVTSGLDLPRPGNGPGNGPGDITSGLGLAHPGNGLGDRNRDITSGLDLPHPGNGLGDRNRDGTSGLDLPRPSGGFGPTPTDRHRDERFGLDLPHLGRGDGVGNGSGAGDLNGAGDSSGPGAAGWDAPREGLHPAPVDLPGPANGTGARHDQGPVAADSAWGPVSGPASASTIEPATTAAATVGAAARPAPSPLSTLSWEDLPPPGKDVSSPFAGVQRLGPPDPDAGPDAADAADDAPSPAGPARSSSATTAPPQPLGASRALPVIVLVALVVVLGAGLAWAVTTHDPAERDRAASVDGTTIDEDEVGGGTTPGNGADVSHVDVTAVENPSGVQLDWDGGTDGNQFVVVLSETEGPRLLQAETGTALLVPGNSLAAQSGYCFAVATTPDPAPAAATVASELPEEALSAASCIRGASPTTVRRG